MMMVIVASWLVSQVRRSKPIERDYDSSELSTDKPVQYTPYVPSQYVSEDAVVTRCPQHLAVCYMNEGLVAPENAEIS
jgi:hypothetical protein